jgi:hypothetical protein
MTTPYNFTTDAASDSHAPTNDRKGSDSKRMKWSPQLHALFVQVVEKIGINSKSN